MSQRNLNYPSNPSTSDSETRLNGGHSVRPFSEAGDESTVGAVDHPHNRVSVIPKGDAHGGYWETFLRSLSTPNQVRPPHYHIQVCGMF